LNFEPDVEVAQSRRRKTHRWLRWFFLFIITPLIVWILAFLIWLFWHDIMRLVAPGKATTRPGARIFPSPSGRGQGEGTPSTRDGEPDKSRDPKPGQRPREDIPDGDRKKLDDILKRR
jgi:hypothetical protein